MTRKTLAVTASISLTIMALGAGITNAKAEGVQYFDLNSAMNNQVAKDAVVDTQVCMVGVIHKMFLAGVRSKLTMAQRSAHLCYMRMAGPFRAQHLVVGVTDSDFEEVVEQIAYNDLIDKVVAEENQSNNGGLS